MVGRTRSASTRPPTRGAERGRPKKFRKTARPSRPNTIDGTAARLLILTSMTCGEPVLGRKLFEIDGGEHADRQTQNERHEERHGGADQCSADARKFRLAAVAGGKEAPVEVAAHIAEFPEALEEGDLLVGDLPAAFRSHIGDDTPSSRRSLCRRGQRQQRLTGR